MRRPFYEIDVLGTASQSEIASGSFLPKDSGALPPDISNNDPKP